MTDSRREMAAGAIEFLKRVQLQGVEVDAYTQIREWLGKIAGGTEEVPEATHITYLTKYVHAIEEAAANNSEFNATLGRIRMLLKQSGVGPPL